MQELEIRIAQPSDLASLVEFNQAIAWETEQKKLDEATLRAGVRAVLNDEQLGLYIVAVDGQRVVGCLMITHEWSDWRNGVFWWIQSVYVDAEFRRRGVYSRLYQHVRSLAKNRNVCGFRLYVERENSVAQKTYERMGMKETVYRMYEQPNER